MALLWRCYGAAMALLWRCYGAASAFLWPLGLGDGASAFIRAKDDLRAVPIQ
jgi:hypothetical protein